MKPRSSASAERLRRDEILTLGAAALFSTLLYLVASALIYRVGFPLDDSWIHQTYARNLALHGQWAFRLDQPSAGSTAPLWSALLAIGFWLRLAPYAWAYLLGALTLWALAVAGEAAARRMAPAYRPRLPWMGLFLVFEWHMAWAGMSGMETLLHALLVTLVLILLMDEPRRYLAAGVLTGLSIWVRPDGLTLLGPALLVILLGERGTRTRLLALQRYLLGFGAFFFAYLLFNLWIGGKPMPNTFYAKQAEYAAWQALPILQRLGQLALQFLAGPSLLLIPGALLWAVRSVRQREWGSLAGMIWFLGYLGLYTARLPFYQHGRYIMPAMPVLFLWGMLGLHDFWRSRTFGRYHWFASTLWQMSLLLVTVLFVGLGARSYGEDVAVIESEMVASAKWADTNLPADAVIAAHDIGALGYFDDHRLIDLAGLVSPEAIPFMRDQKRLASFLDEKGADYLIAFPEFYPELASGRQIVFQSGGEFAAQFSHENMMIYRWK